MSKAVEYIGIDYGEKRLGIARINSQVGIAEPLQVIENNDVALQKILTLVKQYDSEGIVVGLARGLDGQETAQTAACRKYAAMLQSEQDLPVYLIDEAGSSKAADSRLAAGEKGERDSIAAAIILEDFARQQDKTVFEVIGS